MPTRAQTGIVDPLYAKGHAHYKDANAPRIAHVLKVPCTMAAPMPYAPRLCAPWCVRVLGQRAHGSMPRCARVPRGACLGGHAPTSACALERDVPRSARAQQCTRQGSPGACALVRPHTPWCTCTCPSACTSWCARTQARVHPSALAARIVRVLHVHTMHFLCALKLHLACGVCYSHSKESVATSYNTIDTPIMEGFEETVLFQEIIKSHLC